MRIPYHHGAGQVITAEGRGGVRDNICLCSSRAIDGRAAYRVDKPIESELLDDPFGDGLIL